MSSTVVEAIADGHQAAEAMLCFLRGLPVEAPEKSVPAEPLTWQAVPSGVCPQATRLRPGRMDAQARADCFQEECQGLTGDQARAEAERCLNCGASCMQSCPYQVIQFDFDQGRGHKCNLCYDQIVFGERPVCAEACMVDAIVFGEVDTLKEASDGNGREIEPKRSSESVVYLKPKPKNTLAFC